jgi:hypothetical protein
VLRKTTPAEKTAGERARDEREAEARLEAEIKRIAGDLGKSGDNWITPAS